MCSVATQFELQLKIRIDFQPSFDFFSHTSVVLRPKIIHERFKAGCTEHHGTRVLFVDPVKGSNQVGLAALKPREQVLGHLDMPDTCSKEHGCGEEPCFE